MTKISTENQHRKSAQKISTENQHRKSDQDGTLWVEHPMYTQVIYCLERVPMVVAERPELKNVEPFKTVLSGNQEAMAKLSIHPAKRIHELLPWNWRPQSNHPNSLTHGLHRTRTVQTLTQLSFLPRLDLGAMAGGRVVSVD